MAFRTLSVARGSITRQADCETCRCCYQYTLRRIGLGSGRLGLLSASDAAERDLDSALSKAQGVVACPECGHYQPAMIRRQRWFWLKMLLGTGLLTAVLFFLFRAIAAANPRDAESILAIRGWVVGLGIAAIGLSVLMLLLDNPEAVPLMRIFHRTSATCVRPGNRPAGASSPSAPPPAASAAGSAATEEDLGDWPFLDEPADEPEDLTATCHECGRQYQLPAAHRGKKARCTCGKLFRV